jgi:hypothetical protein
MIDLKDEMMMYGVTLGRRNKKKEKRLFLEQVEKVLKENNISYQTVQKQSSVLTVEHLYIHDPKKAKMIVAAAYDTPPASFLSDMKWYPFNKKKNQAKDRLNFFIEACLLVLTWCLAIFLLYRAVRSSMGLRVIEIIGAVILILIGWKITSGRSNPVNFSMNSAGVCVLMALIKAFSKNEKIAFVLMDESVMSLEGAKLMKPDINQKAKILFLGNLSSGSKRLFVHAGKFIRPQQLEELEDKKISEHLAEQSVLGLYPDSAMIIFGDQEDKDLVLPKGRSRKDTEVDMPLLEKTYEELKSALESELE